LNLRSAVTSLRRKRTKKISTKTDWGNDNMTAIGQTIGQGSGIGILDREHTLAKPGFNRHWPSLIAD
jgi:hypothetical protein